MLMDKGVGTLAYMAPEMLGAPQPSKAYGGPAAYDKKVRGLGR